MIVILVIIGISLMYSARRLIRNGSYSGCVEYVVAAIIFVKTGLFLITLDDILFGILSFAVALCNLIHAACGKYSVDDYYDHYYDN
ncbi:MAG: hypothetical protein LBP63_05375 [Prevotellaceae bacterium]|jgi:hypothetical protein|nr:hypothetical protein [Prevotellaceae bacterium]